MIRIIRKKMKIVLIIVVAFFVISIFYGLGQYRSSQQRKLYIAEVNGTGITFDQWQNAFSNAISRYDDKTISSMDQSLINSFKKNILEQIINYELVFQQAEKEKVKISQDDINLEIDKIKDNFSSPEEFNEVLKANKLTLTQLKDDIKRQLMIQYILEEARNKINITDDELLEHYNENQESFFESEKIYARHILVETEEEAKSIIGQLKEGIIDFAELAKEKSICPSAENGGDLGFFAKGQMVKEFEDVAFSLEAGEISDIVKTEFGYHIIKCEEKKEAYNPTFEEVKDQINNTLRYQRENEETLALLSKLKEEANIVINYDFESENASKE
ncbi:MAG: SurA N-terminal domain-containing protein [Candidatus Atribacteria bacterium]|nr:SurA N-terminal domain-containing protein [Candidatus Atribacteria bacterium]